MKPGKVFTALVMVVIAAAVFFYFGAHAFRTLEDPYTTTFAYNYTVNDSTEADGLLVRDERLLEGKDGILDIIRAEGEKVGVNQTVALIHKDVQAQADQAELDVLATEIRLLESAIADSGDLESAARLDEEILNAVVALRASTALGDYTELEDQVLAVKSNILKRGYTYGDGLTADALSAQLRQLRQEYTALNSRSASGTSRIRAPQSGTYSSLVDGYETLVTPENMGTLTPSGLTASMNNPAPVADNAPGKLILGFGWYYAALLPQETADRLLKGSTYTLRFTGEFAQDVDMTVEQISEGEDGNVLVIFSTNRYLTYTTLLRRQQAELIFEEFTGLRIPKEAVHLVKESYEDSTTGEVSERTKLGVYAVVSGRAEFKGVEVVMEGSDYYVVRPTDTGRKILRAGDKIVTSGTGLYNGQLLEY